MRKRTVHIQVWLDRKEAERLDKLVKRSGLSREAYLRHLISGVVPNDAPPPDYLAMMKELYTVGNKLNQIAQKANAVGVIDAGRYEVACKQLDAVIDTITDAVVLPRRME